MLRCISTVVSVYELYGVSNIMPDNKQLDMSAPKTSGDPEQVTTEQLYSNWKRQPGPKTVEPLLSALDPTINRSMQAYGYGGDPNIKTTAQLHVVDALPRFKADKGAKLDTFMFNELKRLRRLGPQQQYAIPVPEQASYDLQAIKRVEHDLEYDLGRPATPEELADASGLSAKRISSIKRQYDIPMVTEQSFDPMTGMPGQTDEPGDTEKMWTEATYGELDPVNQHIMNWSLGLHGQPKMSKTQMAQKLGMSIPAVTQRARKIAIKLSEGTKYRSFLRG